MNSCENKVVSVNEAEQTGSEEPDVTRHTERCSSLRPPGSVAASLF